MPTDTAADRASFIHRWSEPRVTGHGFAWVCLDCERIAGPMPPPREAVCDARALAEIGRLTQRAAELERQIDAATADPNTVGKMQDHVRSELVRHLRASGVPNADNIDGGASDGDEYAFTGAEISQAMSMLEEHVREEGRREGMEAVAAVLDDGFDPWPAVKRTVNVDAMDLRARGGLDAILDAVFADACRAIRDLSASPESAASRYSTASDAGIARESEPAAPVTTVYDVEGDL